MFCLLFAVLCHVQGTKVEKVLSELFEGAFVNIMQCVNVDYCTTRRETFMDLSLDVKVCVQAVHVLGTFSSL